MAEYDSPWKEALDYLFRFFLQFFFPDIHDDIDWTHSYEVLDKELEKLVRQGEMGKRLADKLFKVWRKNGAETWVLIHIEVQSQVETEFGERIYVYNYRIFDRFRRPVASLAVLADTNENWRPDRYSYEQWGCRTTLEFRIVKLKDYASNLAGLAAHANPFGLIVLAHFQSQATLASPGNPCACKVQLTKNLFDRAMDAVDIRQLFRLIDWLLELPVDLEIRFEDEIQKYVRERNMPYLSSLERRAEEKGREEGRQEGLREALLESIADGLRSRFPEPDAALLARIRELQDVEHLRAIQKKLWTAASVQEIQDMLPQRG